jgi:hypothetical protein
MSRPAGSCLGVDFFHLGICRNKSIIKDQKHKRPSVFSQKSFLNHSSAMVYPVAVKVGQRDGSTYMIQVKDFI